MTDHSSLMIDVWGIVIPCTLLHWVFKFLYFPGDSVISSIFVKKVFYMYILYLQSDNLSLTVLSINSYPLIFKNRLLFLLCRLLWLYFYWSSFSLTVYHQFINQIKNTFVSKYLHNWHLSKLTNRLNLQTFCF